MISDEALQALKAATRWNPYGARALLSILKEHPGWVKYKRDEFGPLTLILKAVPHRRMVVPGVEMTYRPGVFPEALIPACGQFGAEWRNRRFTKAELAQAIELILRESSHDDAPNPPPAS